MIHLYGEGNIQLLAAIKRQTGVTVRLRPMEEIKKVQSSGETAMTILTTVYNVTEGRAATMVIGRGKRLITLTRRADLVEAEARRRGVWHGVKGDYFGMGWVMEQITMWEDEFEPFAINHYGPGQSVDDAVAKVKWERMAGRPGSDKAPLDTYDRTNQGYTTPRMKNHWS